jgi:CRISPR-associated protein Cmr4
MSEATHSTKSNARLYFVHALSPLHAGTGEGIGAVNLPTARERLTGYPFLPGTSLKGVLRATAEARFRKEPNGYTSRKTYAAFGPDTENAADSRGGIAFSDASLLALPVRSLFGTFAWVSCPYALRRLRRDARETSVDTSALDAALVEDMGDQAAWLTKDSKLRGESAGDLYLLDLSLPSNLVSVDSRATGIASWISERVWPNATESGDHVGARSLFAERFIVVNDDVFGFLSRTATEIRSRVKIDDDTGTAAESGSWTEEHLPAESLLYGVAIGRPTRYFTGGRSSASGSTSTATKQGEGIDAATAIGVLDELLTSDNLTLRFGGKSSTGMGRARMTIVGGEQ